jgi:hypothetical protein
MESSKKDLVLPVVEKSSAGLEAWKEGKFRKDADPPQRELHRKNEEAQNLEQYSKERIGRDVELVVPYRKIVEMSQLCNGFRRVGK